MNKLRQAGCTYGTREKIWRGLILSLNLGGEPVSAGFVVGLQRIGIVPRLDGVPIIYPQLGKRVGTVGPSLSATATSVTTSGMLLQRQHQIRKLLVSFSQQRAFSTGPTSFFVSNLPPIVSENSNPDRRDVRHNALAHSGVCADPPQLRPEHYTIRDDKS